MDLSRLLFPAIVRNLEKIMTDLEKLEVAVARLEAGEASAIALLQGLSAAILATGGDMGRLRALATEVDGMTERLAKAVAAAPPLPDPIPTPAPADPALPGV